MKKSDSTYQEITVIYYYTAASGMLLYNPVMMHGVVHQKSSEGGKDAAEEDK